MWPLKLYFLRGEEREKRSHMSPSSPNSNRKDPREHTELTASAGREETCPPRYLFSQISIISTVSTSALSQRTRGLTEVLQEDTVLPCHSWKSRGKTIPYLPQLFRKLIGSPRCAKLLQPTLTDYINTNYITQAGEIKRTIIKSTASSSKGQSLNLQLIASITFRAHHKLKHFILPWK